MKNRDLGGRPRTPEHGGISLALAVALGFASSAVVTGVTGGAGALEMELPELVVEAPDELAAVGRRVQGFDRSRLKIAMELVGLEDPGPPIRILVAPEGSYEARLAAPWVVGYASGARGLVVLLPARSPVYPDRSLEAVLHHEVAHVLVARAAGHRPVPRWFNEGLAMAAARPWDFGDQTRFALEALSKNPVSMRDLEAFFAGDEAQVRRAYSLSGAFVRYLVQRFGGEAPGAILRSLGAGAPFPLAFEKATGLSFANAETEFWRRRTGWRRWLPFLSSSVALWMAVTLLALVAIARRRFKDAEQRRQWEEEEMAETFASRGGGGEIN